jgi:hypothetical protein
MSQPPKQFVVVALITSALACLAWQTARAEGDAVQVAPSLRWIPADAAFYASMLHTREQIEAVGRSRAWATLKGLPLVQALWKKGMDQIRKPDSPLASLWQLYQLPENQQLLQMLADMGSEEIFVYGDKNCAEFAQLASQISNGVRFGPAFFQLSGQAKGVDSGKLQALSVLKTLSANLEHLRVPDLVMGFKISDPSRAETQIKRLEKLLEGMAQENPQYKGRLKRERIGGGDFVTVALDGRLVPWDRISFEDIETEAGQFDKLREKLKDLKMTLSVGIKDQYLIVTVGESSAPAARLGQGAKLADRPEFKRLKPFLSQRFTTISYTSQAMHAEFATKKKDVDDWIATANRYLKDAGLPQEKQTRARKDLNELAKDIKGLIPEVGAVLGFSFMTDRGQEGYSYDWSELSSVDSSKPLSLLNHCGGNPVLAVVGRAKYSPETYRLLVKWLKVAYGYVDDFVVPRLDDAKKEQYEQFRKIALPLLQRLDKATGEMLLPALADGQYAFVADAKIKSKQWIRGIPAADASLPMLEPALVLGVSDAALLRRAMEEYRSIANDAIARVRDIWPIVPAFEIPEPETKMVKSGTLYLFPLPEFMGLDPQLVPNAGLSSHVAVIAITEQHSERLLSKTPLKTSGGPLADLGRPLAGAVYFDWAALVEALRPWADFGLAEAGPDPLGELIDESAAKDQNRGENLRKQVHTLLEVLKVLRGASSVTYVEDGVLVTHAEIVIKDM